MNGAHTLVRLKLDFGDDTLAPGAFHLVDEFALRQGQLNPFSDGRASNNANCILVVHLQ